MAKKHKITPHFCCVWFAINKQTVAAFQERVYSEAETRHTCRSMNCPTYDQADRLCLPAGDDSCPRCNHVIFGQDDSRPEGRKPCDP